MYNFVFIEDISSNNIEPLFNASLINNSAKYPISEYFYHLKEEEKQVLEEIYNYAKKIEGNYFNNIINKNIWLKYLIAKNIKINPISKATNKGTIKIENDNSIIVNYGNNGKYKELDFENIDLYSIKSKYQPGKLFDIKKEVPIATENKLFLCKNGTYENNVELLYMLLDCIFNSNTNFYIKKCERCNNFFLTTKINKKYCYRPRVVCGKQTTCNGAKETFNKSKEYMAIRRIMANHLSKYYKKNDSKSLSYIYNYQNKYYELLNKCREKLDITDDDINAFKDINLV